MDVNKIYPSNYMKATDLNGQDIQVVISSITMEQMGDGEQKPIVYFQNMEKGVVLNKTNATNIAGQYGPETDNWIGRPVTLYSTWVDFQGRSVEAIRIRGASQQAQQAVQPSPPFQATQQAPGLEGQHPNAPNQPNQSGDPGYKPFPGDTK
jgi:hypothetical protein